MAGFADAFGLSPAGLRQIGGGHEGSDGTVWREAGGRRVLKVMALPVGDPGAAATRDRLRLAGQLVLGGAPLVRPQPARGGELVVSVQSGDCEFLGYCYPFVTGRPMKPTDACVRSGAYYRAVGHQLARMHDASQASGWPRRVDGTSPASAVLGGWRQEWSLLRGWCGDDRVAAAWERLHEALARLPVGSATYGFTQNDAHVANLLFDPDTAPARSGGEPGLTLIDLDVANFHWYLCDVATALYSFQYTLLGRPEESGPELPEGFTEFAGEALREGYRRVRDIGADWQDLVEVFLQYRRCLLFIVLQGAAAADRQWHDQWVGRIQAWDRRLFG